MQATVATYHPDTRTGTVLLDDGVAVAFSAGTLRASVRHLRPGQRVHVEVAAAPTDGAAPTVLDVSIH